jgi:DNA polymerase-1
MPADLTQADHSASQLRDELASIGLKHGEFIGLTVVPALGVGLSVPSHDLQRSLARTEPALVVRQLEEQFRPRWVWWSNETPATLLPEGLRLARCWDLAAVHRVLFGGWRTDPGRIWAALHDLSEQSLPASGQLDLLGHAGDEGGDPDDPVQPDGHLRPGWINGSWTSAPERWSRWAHTAAIACRLQQDRMNQLAKNPADGERWSSTCRSESAAELLCAELGFDGLPIDRVQAEQLISTFVGPRPRDEEDAGAIRRRRDAAVLRHVPGLDVDLRSPGQVKAMLARVGIDVPDTRSWRLEVFRGAHPVVEALLGWRKDERFATTYGYDWLDRQAGPDDRLRGSWTGCDGGAGRMTASAGLHSMPADLRPAVAAAAGHLLVRADLGQIEPRVLAAVSADPALVAATADDDLYAPVAARLAVDRPVAKVAVLAAMYGQTSGAAGEALKGLERAYPIAMRYLRAAYDAGRAGHDIRTYGGRLVRMWPTPSGLSEPDERANVASRGRYARNAVIQGAAAELFKAWAVTVRARIVALDAHIVLCLHDELLVHAPADRAEAAAQLLEDCLAEAAGRWAVQSTVRFVADVSVIERWSQAKG